MAKMSGIFVNENGCIHYAKLIVDGVKVVETRNRDMLKSLVGKRVAIVRTRRGKNPMVIGYVTIAYKSYCYAEDFRLNEKYHLVPEGSAYDVHGKGKWFYWLEGAEECTPFPLPSDAVRHGMSWCEYDDPNYVELRPCWEQKQKIEEKLSKIRKENK